MEIHSQSFDTLSLHADSHDKPLKSHTYPIFQTSAFVFDSPDHGRQLFAGEEKGHIYSRIGNPTVEEFEKIMCTLEEGAGSCAFASGMSAIVGCTLPFLSSGDHIIVGDTLYGPSTSVLTVRYMKFGIESTIVDTSVIEKVQAAMKPNTKMVFIETPANPTAKISDIAAIAEIAHAHNAIVVVDGTFATPYNCKPLLLGSDISVHSLTKYLNGHGDVVGGIVTGKTAALVQTVRLWRKDTGSILGPFDAWLVMRGLKTLAVRMERHNFNARRVAEFLKSRPEVSVVMYPGFADFHNHDVAVKQMRKGGFGSTFSFCMRDGYDAAKRLLENLKLCTVAVSLGATDTLIEHPASMTHASVPEALMKQQGLTKDLVRISVGLEDSDDIIADLKQGMEALAAK